MSDAIIYRNSFLLAEIARIIAKVNISKSQIVFIIDK